MIRNPIILAFAAIIIIIPFFSSLAGDSTQIGWKKTLNLDLTTTQSAYSNSWIGGESGSLNWVSNLTGTAENQLKSWANFRTTLRASFGQTLTQDEQSKDWSKPRKSTDLIDWENLARFTTNAFVDPYVALRLETQFYTQFSDIAKAYLRPLKFTESAGIARKFYAKDKDQVLSRVGLALREIVKASVSDTDSSKTIDSIFTDGGLEWVSDATLTLSDKIQYIGKLTLFKALFFSNSDNVKGTPHENDWKAIDLNWENGVRVQVTKIITVNLYTQLLYDKETSKQGRFKEILGLGIFFKLI